MDCNRMNLYDTKVNAMKSNVTNTLYGICVVQRMHLQYSEMYNVHSALCAACVVCTACICPTALYLSLWMRFISTAHCIVCSFQMQFIPTALHSVLFPDALGDHFVG